MLHPLRPVLTALLLLGALIPTIGPASAQQSTPARAAIVIDMLSGAVLLEKNADEMLPPASMSKLMTNMMVFEQLDSGRLKLSDQFLISANAAALGGSRMFVRQGSRVSVENLLRGVVIQSGNDAAVALAEAIAGTEDDFAKLMNRRAGELGIENARFANATGWPHPDHRISVRALAQIAERIIRDFPEHYKLFSEREFTWDGITQRNRNPLLGSVEGADGLKTGHTSEAGYGLVASAEREGRRVLLVVAGLESVGQRRQEAERLMNWAFRAFDTKILQKAGEPVIDAATWTGAAPTVPLAPAENVILTAPLGDLDRATVTALYEGPLPAPIAEGDVLGALEIEVPGLPVRRVPLVATVDVAPGGFLVRMEAAAELLFYRALALAGL
ncbi:MAG: D-alanyl-D-alanine carboxypeptidase family protein [Pseudomonadota bacterium]